MFLNYVNGHLEKFADSFNILDQRILKKSFSIALVKWRRPYRGAKGETSHFSVKLYKFF